jgi:hypothetical protein
LSNYFWNPASAAVTEFGGSPNILLGNSNQYPSSKDQIAVAHRFPKWILRSRICIENRNGGLILGTGRLPILGAGERHGWVKCG